MGFWQGLKFVYRESLAFLFACPLLALIPVAFEMLQHVVEVRIGMYDSPEAAVATESHPLRMGFGFLKVAALTLPFYWATRFFARHRDAAFARRADRAATQGFALVLLFSLAMAAIQLFALPRDNAAILIITTVLSYIVAVLLARWYAGAPLGLSALGPSRSAKAMARHVPWGFAFLIVAILPLMIPHYALGAFAILGPRSLLWPVLIVDSLLVGWLAIVVVAANWVMAQRPGPLDA